MKDNIKEAVKQAENELQEKEIANLKNIIKNLLTKLKDKEKSKDEIQEEIKIIKQDIDDFKAGRLDRIKERHETNEKADKVCPINITIINDNSRTVYPTQPWRWNYIVNWNNYPTITSSTYTVGSNYINCQANAVLTCTNSGINNLTCGGASSSLAMMTQGMQCGAGGTSGQTYANFAGGTYDINGTIINL